MILKVTSGIRLTERAKKEGGIKSTEPIYVLAKISNSGKTLETVKYSVDYPTELDPDELRYHYEILYRQE